MLGEGEREALQTKEEEAGLDGRVRQGVFTMRQAKDSWKDGKAMLGDKRLLHQLCLQTAGRSCKESTRLTASWTAATLTIGYLGGPRWQRKNS